MPRRLPALDGLRGIAALVVLVYHALMTVPGLARGDGPDPARAEPWWLAQTPLHLVWAGTEAVYVFFILSGFVLVLPFVSDRPPAARAWAAYYPRRLVRLYLPVAASVAFAVALLALVPRSVHAGFSWWFNGHADGVHLAGLVRDVTVVTGLGNPWLNSPLWSLRWEMTFSLLLPVYVLAVRWTRRVWWLAPAGVAAAAAVGSTGVQALFYLSMFAVGAVAAAHREWLVSRTVAGGPRLWVVLGLAALASFELRWLTPEVPATSFAALVGSFLVFVLFLGAAPAVRLGSSAPVAWLGKVSFSLYLVHVPVILLVGQFATAGGPVVTSLVMLAVGGPLSLLVATGFHRLVEFPSLRLAQRVGRATDRLVAGGPRTPAVETRVGPGGPALPASEVVPATRSVSAAETIPAARNDDRPDDVPRAPSPVA